MKPFVFMTFALLTTTVSAANPAQSSKNEDWYCSGEGIEANHGPVFVSIQIKGPGTNKESVSIEVHPKGKRPMNIVSYSSGIYYANNPANSTVALVAASRNGVTRIGIDAGTFDQGFNGTLDFSQPLVSFSGVSSDALKCQYSIDGVPVTGL